MSYFKQPTPETLAENRRIAAEKQSRLGQRPNNGYRAGDGNGTWLEDLLADNAQQEAKLVKPHSQSESDKLEAARKRAAEKFDKLGRGR